MPKTSKNIIFATVLIAGVTFIGLSQPTYAVVSCPNGELADNFDQCPMPISDEDLSGEPVVTNDEPTAINDDTDTSSNDHSQGELQPNDPEDADTSDQEDCNDEACTDTNWPIYLSFGALGLTLLLIIIINLTSRKRRQ